MTRLATLLGTASIVLTVGLVAGHATGRNGTEDHHPEAWLDALDPVFEGVGLRRRTDVNIQINSRDVARGYSRPGCDGLLLASPLPRTAQSWLHVAPRLDLAHFEIQYMYRGMVFKTVPAPRRLLDRLLGELAGKSALVAPRVTALAERGHCGLLSAAVEVLADAVLPGTGIPDRENSQS